MADTRDRIRLAKAKARQQIDAGRKALRMAEAAERAATVKATTTRRYQVGTLADAAGLLPLDDAVLREVFRLTRHLAQDPDTLSQWLAVSKTMADGPQQEGSMDGRTYPSSTGGTCGATPGRGEDPESCGLVSALRAE